MRVHVCGFPTNSRKMFCGHMVDVLEVMGLASECVDLFNRIIGNFINVDFWICFGFSRPD